nr:DUF1501 domain-containing protein [Armatimonas sp.]
MNITRREILSTAATGFGGLAASALFADEAHAQANGQKLDHPAKAKAVIFLYMDGGPSQMDTFDPKPRLEKDHGKPLPMDVPPTQFNNNGTILKSPWTFKKYGQSGLDVSELFPEVAKCADDLCVMRSMTSNFSEHTNANYFLHTGNGSQGRPSMGAWVTYGLGSTAKNLPGYVVINGGLIPNGGLDCFGSGFLPPTYQGSIFLPRPSAVADLKPLEKTEALQKRKLALLKRLDQSILGKMGNSSAVDAAIQNYELAFSMQSAVPELTSMADETEATKKLYGLDHPFAPARTFGFQCLMARRMVERGVRFVELTHPSCGHDRWDQHGNLKQGHEDNARMVDTAIAGLLKDLKARGMLDSTIVLWGSEFGRTPMVQGSNGRDHNPFGFTVWAAGGGFKGGTIYGATDEFGYFAVENKMEMHDLHATMLHLLGFDHKKLTVRFGGRDMRLTDVFGNVIKELIV